MTFTREPSAKRASTIGEDSSTRRPIAETILSMMCMSCASSLNIILLLFKHSGALYIDLFRAVDQNVADGRILQ